MRRPQRMISAGLVLLLMLGLFLVSRQGNFLPGAASADAPLAQPVVGDVPPSDQISLIANPGTFGLGPNLPESRYAIIGTHLVRISESDGKILSILRPLPRLP